MAYADFDFYQNTYYGDTLTQANADKWLSMAADELDTLTFGRLTFAFPTVEAHAARVRKAVCAIAEALYCIDAQQKAVAASKAADGTYRGAVASVSSGRESISFSAGGASASASTFAAAAANTAERAKLIGSIAARYLATIPDAGGVNLLYAGEVRHVRKHDHPV